MPHLETAFVRYHHFDKLKTRIMPTVLEYTTSLRLDVQNNTLATLIAMLRRGDEECTSERPAEPGLFDTTKEEPTPTGTSTLREGGVVMQQQKQDQPEEVLDEDKKDDKKEEKKEKGSPKDNKKPNAFSRMGKWFKDLATDLVEEK